jgi:hypothetical protein
MNTITNDYAKEMAKYLASQLDVTLAQAAYLECDNLDHVDCKCKVLWGETLTTDDASFEEYIYQKIDDFIEGV